MNNEIKKIEDKKNYGYGSYYTNRKNYDKKGKKNITSFPKFIEICKMSQEKLKLYLVEELVKAGYTDIVNDDGYIYAKGTNPVLLTAHMDTVHKELVKNYYEYYEKETDHHIISSPQGIGGDDRCGIYMILEIIKEHKPSILFCEDEEIGGIGSRKFCKTEFIMELSELNYLIELDRANGEDVVFYDCGNPEFTNFILENTGYGEALGSFSDISNLSPECMIASVNLSCGYYNAHTTSEYVIMEEMLNTIKVVKELLSLENVSQYEYIEVYYGGYYGNYYEKYYGNSRYYDDYYDDNDYDWYQKINKKEDVKETVIIQVIWYGKENEELTDICYGNSVKEAFGDFFINHTDLSYNDIFDYYLL